MGSWWLDGIALALCVYFIVSGALRGALVSFLGIFSLVASYLAAFLIGPIVGPLLQLTFGMPGLTATVVASSGVFFLVFAVMGLVSSLVGRARKRDDDGDAPRSGFDRLGGALCGAFQGAMIALLLGVLASWIEVGQARGAFESLPRGGGRGVSTASELVIGGAADAVLDEDDRGARAAIRLAVRPESTLADVEALMAHPSVRKLQADPLFWSYLEHGSVDQALNHRAFVTISQDRELRSRLADLGLIGPSAADDPAAFRAEARVVLGEVAPRLRVLKSDPALAELSRDPEMIDALQRGDSLTLLSDPRFRALVDRVLDAKPSESEPES